MYLRQIAKEASVQLVPRGQIPTRGDEGTRQPCGTRGVSVSGEAVRWVCDLCLPHLTGRTCRDTER